MSTTLHDPEDKKTYHKGANSDLEKEFVGRGEPGKYINAQNMRPEPIDGEQGALSKIKGEILLFPGNEPGAQTYICLLACEVGGHNVQYWANTDTQYPPLVMIDGLVMVKSALLPWLWDKPFQWARAEDCDEGLLLAVDDNSIPMLFSIADIIEKFNAGSLLYFDDFDPAVYYINPTAPVERPKFLGLVDVGAGGGLKPGNYWYSLRFVDADGNRTNIGPAVGRIFVPVNLGGVTGYTPEPGWPGASLQGGALSDVGQPTKYGAHLRFRINNTGNYSRIELLRTQVNQGDGASTAPVTWLAHAIDINFGINPWVDFTDIGTELELLADAEVNTQALFIVKAKGVRYIDNRYVLANIEVAPKDVEITFREVGGQKMFAITKSIGKAGHHDPVNHCYFPTEIRGERRRYGVQLFDGLGGKSFVIPLPDEFTSPNRRDEKSGDSLFYSDASCWAANVDHVVTPTFEAFDMDTAVKQTDVASFTNIMVDGARKQDVVDDYFPYPSLPSSVNTYVDTDYDSVKTIDCRPLRPVRPTDGQFGHNYRVNTSVRDSGFVTSPEVGYDPQVFEPTFHSLGGCIYGLLNLFPWVSGFSIVQSDPAGRVICQGLASYKFDVGAGQQSGKSIFKATCHFPDINTGVVPEEDVIDFENNPQSYSIQAVSPVGFTTQVLGGVSLRQRPTVFAIDLGFNNYDLQITSDSQSNDPSYGTSHLTDQLSVARVLYDEGQANPIYTVAGVQPTLPGTPHANNVGFSAWRNAVPGNSPFHGGGNNGNSLLAISSVSPVTTPAGSSHYDISFQGALYGNATPDIGGFSSTGTKNFHEPFYIVNLVQDGATVDAALIDGWIPTGHYQRIRGIIGESNGQGNQQFPLIDERVDDVLTPLGLPLEERYLWVGNNAWICITNTGINAAQLINDVNQNGFWLSPLGVQVYGFYQVLPSNNDIEIGFFGVNPPAGSRIEVRYNSNAPIKFFGGDATISQALSMPVNGLGSIAYSTVYGPTNDQIGPLLGPPFLDPNSQANIPDAGLPTLQYDGADGILDTGFFGPSTIPLPHFAYKYNPRHYVPFGIVDKGGGNPQINIINNPSNYEHGGRAAANPTLDIFPATIRQWGILFDVESRTPLHLSAFVFNSADNQAPQHVKYAMRPYEFFQSDTLANNGVFDGYGTEYGSNEKSGWQRGGLRWNTPSNYDYLSQRKKSSFSKPAFGYEEKTDLCNVVVWTPRVTSQVQNSPGYRTYPATNIRWLQSDTGGINKLYSAVSSNGFNLYALTETGVCELLIGKNILTSADGNALATTRQDEFIGAEVWRSKMIGIPDMCWQLCGEGYWGNPKADALYFADRMSAYVLVGSQIVDIGKGQYRTQIQPLVQAAASSNIAMMNGWFDASRDEWGFSARSNVRVGTDFELVTDPSKTLVYSASPLIQGWVGEFTYLFDKVFHLRGSVYGMRDQQTWLLDQGYVLNGQPIEAWAHQVSAPLAEERMEWLWIKVGSILKPTYVKFYDEDDNHVCTLDAAAAVSFGYAPDTYLKRTAGWERQIPRRTANRQRLQGQRMGFRVGHIGEDPFRLPGASVQWKKIK